MKFIKSPRFLLIILLFSQLFAFPQWIELNSGIGSNLKGVHFITDSIGFVVGNNGTVLKTTDTGNTWLDIYSNSTNLNCVWAIDEDTIYVGGNDLYKTTDGGNTWINLNLGYTITNLYFINAQIGFITRLVYDTCEYSGGGPYYTPQYIYYRTSDYGNNWFFQNGEVGNEDLDFTSSNIGYFSTSCLGENGIHCSYDYHYSLNKTTDAGETWNNLIYEYDGGPKPSSFINDTLGYFLEYNNVKKTTDGANTYIDITSNIGSLYWKPNFYKFVNEFEGYIVKDTSIYKTTSNGVYWFTDYSSSDNLNDGFITDNNYAYIVGNNGKILRNILNPVTSSQNISITNSVNFGQTTIHTTKYLEFEIANLNTTSVEVHISSSDIFKISLENNPVYNTTIETFSIPAQSDTIINVKFTAYDAITYKDTIFVNIEDTVFKVIANGIGTYDFMGNISADTIFCQDTIVIIGDVYVDENITLTICPGTVIEFKGNYKFQVNGKILAEGTENDSISFVPFLGVQEWKGIYYDNQNTQDTSLLKYCNIRNAFRGLSATKAPNTLYNLIISNSKIYNNHDHGILSSSFENLKIINCNLFNNLRAIYLNKANNVKIINCEIHDNSYMYNNYSIDGAAILSDNSNTIIKSNKIYNNGLQADFGPFVVSIKNNSSSEIIQNLIFNNSFVGLGCQSSSVNIINNIICNNDYGIEIENSNNQIKNNILRGNDYGGQIFPITGLNVTYCNIQGGYTGTGNIDEIPQFINPTNQVGVIDNNFTFNWAISSSSPCVDAGTPDTSTLNLSSNDITGNTRFMNGRVDIGAYENQFNKYPQNTHICNNDSVAFEVEPISQTTYSYQWYKDETKLIGETNSHLVINPVTVSDTGQYYCFVYSTTDTINTYSFNIVIDSLLPIIISQTESDSLNVGDSILFMIEANYTENYNWYKNNTPINETNFSFSIDSVTINSEGTYICEISNVCGIVKSVPINIIIFPEELNDLDLISPFKIYPNPTKGKFKIKGENINKIEIIDLNGSVVFLHENYTSPKYIDLSQLKNGIYILKITSSNGCFKQKIIKK